LYHLFQALDFGTINFNVPQNELSS